MYNFQLQNKSWGCNVQHADHSWRHYIAYLEVATRVDLEGFHHKKKNFITIDGDDVNYCSDHFAIYILCSVPKINIKLYVNYTSI